MKNLGLFDFMTKSFLISLCALSLFTAVTASAAEFRKATQNEKIAACNKAIPVMPSENGKRVTLEACLKFQFTAEDESPALTQIEMIGQTVEDMATVCDVVLVRNPAFEVMPAPPECRLE